MSLVRYSKITKTYRALVLWVSWIYLINSIGARLHSDDPATVNSASNNGSSFNSRFGDHEYVYESSWPIMDRKLGSVSAVAVDGEGNVVIFHRASHVWSLTSFDAENRFQNTTNGPIAQHTVLNLHRDTGQIIQEWGDNLFYMPHGLTIDHEQNYWLTDVALHQVLKFDLKNSTKKPTLVLGKRFEPGHDMYHFCKPTAVAVLKSGEFFVADGYCNGRIVKYSADGQPMLTWGRNSFILTRTFQLPTGPVPESFFAIPHALTLAPDRGLLCVADREQGRVQCFHTGNGTFHAQYSSPDIGSRLFSVKYVANDGGLLYIINGPQFNLDAKPVRGFIVKMSSGKVVGRFQPNNLLNAFANPHELAVTDDGSEVYVAELDPQMVHKFRRLRRESSSPLPLENSSAHDDGYAKAHFGKSSVSPMFTDSKAAIGISGLSVGSIGMFSIVSTLFVTTLLAILMARVTCFRSDKRVLRIDEVPLQNMAEEA